MTRAECQAPLLALDSSSERALELRDVLRLLARFASSDLGQQHLRALSPCSERAWIEQRQALGQDAIAWLSTRGALVPALDVSVLALADALRDPHGWLEPSGVLGLASLLEATTNLIEQLAESESDHRDQPPATDLQRMVAARLDPRCVQALAELVRSVRKVLAPSGDVRPDASPLLSRLRARVRSQRDDLYRGFERFVSSHREELGEETVSLRDGRLALLLPVGNKGRLPGVVHGRSGTGRSYYFEPLELVEGNNELELAQAEEDAERQRILAELERLIRESSGDVVAALELLGELDALQAVARFARELGAHFPALASHGARLRAARHPLLDPRLAALREEVLGTPGNRSAIVPLDLDFADDRVVVITGPNAGGKTVVLKTLGLLTLMAHCGLPIPAAEGTTITLLERLVAVVGDEQSLLEDRSTFSSQLLRWKAAWEAASPGSLVLVDELGSGTSPQEGAALGLSLLECLCERGGWALLTTHLVEIAAATYELPAARALAMEFDGETALPTFRLRTSGLGGSEALALARRLGLPAEWVERAESRLGAEHRDLRRLLDEADRLRTQARAERDRLESERRSAEQLRGRLEAEWSEARSERSALRKRWELEIALFRKEASRRLEREIAKLPEETGVGGSKRAARRAGEQALSRVIAGAPRIEAEAADESVTQQPGRALEIGDEVVHRALGWRGHLHALAAGRAEVAVAGKRLRCRVEELELATEAGRRRKDHGQVSDPEARDIRIELNVIGQRVEPALRNLDDYLDQALRSSLDRLRVIHGHGTGVLRRAVREHLRGHPAVASVEPAPPEEGGDGATIVTLRSGAFEA